MQFVYSSWVSIDVSLGVSHLICLIYYCEVHDEGFGCGASESLSGRLSMFLIMQVMLEQRWWYELSRHGEAVSLGIRRFTLSPDKLDNCLLKRKYHHVSKTGTVFMDISHNLFFQTKTLFSHINNFYYSIISWAKTVLLHVESNGMECFCEGKYFHSTHRTCRNFSWPTMEYANNFRSPLQLHDVLTLIFEVE